MSPIHRQQVCILLDRDGLLNVNTHYPHTRENLLLNIDFLEEFLFKMVTLSKFSKIEIKFAVVTNQSGVAKGYFSKQECLDFENLLFEEISKSYYAGVIRFPVYHCWSDDENDPRRKPNPGLLLEALTDFNIKPENSFMIGDKKSDVLAGQRAGCRQSLLYKPSLKNANDIFQIVKNELHYMNDHLK